MKMFAACDVFRSRILTLAQTVSAEFQRPNWKRYTDVFLPAWCYTSMVSVVIVCLSVHLSVC